MTVDDEVDVVAVSPAPSSNTEEKKYYCQRCLNHGLQFTRKGHKPHCKYATCNCTQCRMVEERRQLNNMLSRRKVPTAPSEMINGRRIRDPKCARCSAHGVKKPLRGHKKTACPFYSCKCQLCGLVENRRSLMAKQIKLRRDQQRERQRQELGMMIGDMQNEMMEDSGKENNDNNSPTVVVPRPVMPLPTVPPPLMNMPVNPLLSLEHLQQAMSLQFSNNLPSPTLPYLSPLGMYPPVDGNSLGMQMQAALMNPAAFNLLFNFQSLMGLHQNQ